MPYHQQTGRFIFLFDSKLQIGQKLYRISKALLFAKNCMLYVLKWNYFPFNFYTFSMTWNYGMPYLRCDISCSLNKSDVLVDKMKILSHEDLYNPLFLFVQILILLIFVRSCNQNSYFLINPFIRQASTDNVYSYASSIKIFMLCFY